MPKNGAAVFKFDDITTFKVIVMNADLEAVKAMESDADNVGEMSEKNVGEKLTERQRIILNHMEQNNVVSSKAIAMLLQITDRTVEREIQKLKEMEVIERVGADKGGYWKVKQ